MTLLLVPAFSMLMLVLSHLHPLTNPILGIDFLHHLVLLVDVKHNRLLNLPLKFTPTLTVFSCPVQQLTTPTSTFDAILHEFPAAIQPCTYHCPVKHTVTH